MEDTFVEEVTHAEEPEFDSIPAPLSSPDLNGDSNWNFDNES